MKKSIIINQELHNRIKSYTDRHSLYLGKFVESMIDKELFHFELTDYENDHRELMNEFDKLENNIFSKIKIEGYDIDTDPDYIRLQSARKEFYDKFYKKQL